MISTETRHTILSIVIRIKSFVFKMLDNDKLKKYYLLGNMVYFMIALKIFDSSNNVSSVDELGLKIRLVVFWLILNGLIIFVFGDGLINYLYQKDFEEIGFKNKVGIYPILVSRDINGKKIILRFNSSGISYDTWEDNILKLENVLNITISEISTGKTDSEIILKGYVGKYDWNKPIRWDDHYTTHDNRLIVGRSVGGNIFCDLNTYAHILIGGMTGSGKTILLKQLILQCIANRYQVYIADFKQGVDYPNSWKEQCNFMTNRTAVINQLKIIDIELENRLSLFSEYGCKDIESFNEVIEGKIDRIIFACDEVTELLDTTGMEKDEKAQVKVVEGYISKIARLGRAAGIHLLLATQRPDADVLNGQIKSNMTYRLCGRANEVLSRIILDSTDASKRIPKDSIGVFINHDGVRIKGFDVRNDDLEALINTQNSK